MQYLLFSHGKSGSTNAPKLYVYTYIDRLVYFLKNV
jgi:hypothetical protein